MENHFKKKSHRSHEAARNAVALIPLRARSTSSRSGHIDAIDAWVDAAPAVVGQAFVDVVAVEAVTAVAGRTRAASVK